MSAEWNYPGSNRTTNTKLLELLEHWPAERYLPMQKRDGALSGKRLASLLERRCQNGYQSAEGCLPLFIPHPVLRPFLWFFSRKSEEKKNSSVWQKSVKNQRRIFRRWLKLLFVNVTNSACYEGLSKCPGVSNTSSGYMLFPVLHGFNRKFQISFPCW